MRHLLLTTAAFALVLSLGATAFAEEDEIVVTATRQPTPLARLPARVEVIDRDDIEARALVTLSEALGAEAVQSGGPGQQSSLFLRGANSKHVLALFDGVRLNDASTPNGQYDFGLDTLAAVERVEVLRGPASAVYGADAVGGVVNILPRRGGERPFEAFAEAALGDFGAGRVALGANGAAGDFEYGVSAERFDTKGFDLVPARMRTQTGAADGARIDTFNASARYERGGQAFDVLLRARDSQTEFDTFSGGACFCLRADDPDLANDGQQRLWRLGGELDAGAAGRLRLSGGQLLSDRAERDDGLTTATARSTRDFAELSANYRFGEATLNVGAAFERNSIDTTSPFADALSIRERQTGAYVITQVPFASAFTTTASARLDEYQHFGRHATYAFGLVAHAGAVRTYASFATAFKAPSLSERFETSFFNVGNPDLEPETSRNWEIGADWRASENLTLGGDVYRASIAHLIEYDFASRQNINVGRADIDGAEAYAEWSPFSWISARLGYAWTDARNGVTGARLARRPEHAWRLEARLAPTDRLTLALTWSHVGARRDVTYDDDGNFLDASGSVEAFHLGALAGTYALSSKLDLFARLDNLTDETYEQPAAFAGAPRAGSFGLRARF